MLKFLEQKLGIPQLYPIEIGDELPYLQYIYKHLKEVWYGLMIADLREPHPEVDSFIAKFQVKWNNTFWGSIFYSNGGKLRPCVFNCEACQTS